MSEELKTALDNLREAEKEMKKTEEARDFGKVTEHIESAISCLLYVE